MTGWKDGVVVNFLWSGTVNRRQASVQANVVTMPVQSGLPSSVSLEWWSRCEVGGDREEPRVGLEFFERLAIVLRVGERKWRTLRNFIFGNMLST